MEKVCIFGAGYVGAALALYLAAERTADVVLVDADPGRAAGLAMDLDQAFPLRGFDIRISAAAEADALSGAAVVVLAASASPDPAEIDSELLRRNGRIVEAACRQIRQHAPDAVVLVVTSPLGAMTGLAREALEFPRGRVIGMSGSLHAARLQTFLAEELGVLPADVTAMVLGAHGEHLVPVPRYCTVAGVPITELLPYEKIHDLIERTRVVDETMHGLIGDRTASIAPAAALAEMVECIVRDRCRLTCGTVCLDGEYGVSGLPLGVPLVLGRQGVVKIVEVALLESERAALQRAAGRVGEQLALWRRRD